jgi:hypothetical protein
MKHKFGGSTIDVSLHLPPGGRDQARCCPQAPVNVLDLLKFGKCMLERGIARAVVCAGRENDKVARPRFETLCECSKETLGREGG